MSDLEQIAYDNAIRALDKQEKLLEELRARTGVLLAAASSAASLLGGRAFQEPHAVALVVIAFAAFALSFCASLFVLLPRAFVFDLEGPVVYERLQEIRDDTAEIHRRLAYQLQRFWEGNDALLSRIDRAFRVAASTLVIEVLTLTVLAAGIL